LGNILEHCALSSDDEPHKMSMLDKDRQDSHLDLTMPDGRRIDPGDRSVLQTEKSVVNLKIVAQREHVRCLLAWVLSRKKRLKIRKNTFFKQSRFFFNCF
jgi:hypothetical protein